MTTLLAEPVEDRSNVPEKIWDITKALVSEHPPSNPVVIMKAADWWYKNGRGVNDPAFKYAVCRLDSSVNGNYGNDVELFGDLLDYLSEIDGAGASK